MRRSALFGGRIRGDARPALAADVPSPYGFWTLEAPPSLAL